MSDCPHCGNGRLLFECMEGPPLLTPNTERRWLYRCLNCMRHVAFDPPDYRPSVAPSDTSV